MSQQTIGETTGGCADVEHGLALNVNCEFAQGLFELESAAADIRRRGFNADRSSPVDQAARFGYALIIDEDFARQNLASTFFSADHELAVNQQKV
jgi:hypothetical protein